MKFLGDGCMILEILYIQGRCTVFLDLCYQSCFCLYTGTYQEGSSGFPVKVGDGTNSSPRYAASAVSNAISGIEHKFVTGNPKEPLRIQSG